MTCKTDFSKCLDVAGLIEQPEGDMLHMLMS